jgi:glycosyltransferase involved in cell wall biosynthesis
MEQVKISVLIPTYNRSNYIAECLESILSQTIKPFEVIVIDDGSSDDTATVLQAYRDRIIYLRKENGGKPSALNFGLSIVRGDYIWLFDDDDVALPQAIEMRLECLQQRPEVDFVFAGHYYGSNDENGKIKRGRCYRFPMSLHKGVMPEILKGCSFTLSSVLARRSVYDKVGPFDETLFASEDYDMLIRMASMFVGVGINNPCYIVREHDGSRGAQQIRYSEKDRAKVLRKYDQAVGIKIRNLLPLSAYSISEVAPYVYYLERMVVMASKGLVPPLLDDLCEALRICPQVDHGDGAARIKKSCAEAVITGYAVEAIMCDWSYFYSRLRLLSSNLFARSAWFGFATGFFIRAKSYPGPIFLRFKYLYFAFLCLWLIIGI